MSKARAGTRKPNNLQERSSPSPDDGSSNSLLALEQEHLESGFMESVWS